MNYANIITASCVDFNGWSVVLQVSGCAFKCKGCFNTSAQNPRSGSPFTNETYLELCEAIDKPFISNICIQGGDIFFKLNVEEGIELLKRLKKDFPNKKLIVWTGYTYAQLLSDPVRSEALSVIDLLMDGKFEVDKPTEKLYRGSDNQILHWIENGISIKQG